MDSDKLFSLDIRYVEKMTIVENIDSICERLNMSSKQIMEYWGRKLRVKSYGNRLVGYHRVTRLLTLFREFNYIYIQCSECNFVDTLLRIKSKQSVFKTCTRCGFDVMIKGDQFV